MYLEFITTSLDKHTLEYFRDKVEYIEMLMMCGAESEVRDCLIHLRHRLQRFITTKGIMANRLKNEMSDEKHIGALALMPYDIRLIITRSL